jgi:hypothetical protein
LADILFFKTEARIPRKVGDVIEVSGGEIIDADY